MPPARLNPLRSYSLVIVSSLSACDTPMSMRVTLRSRHHATNASSNKSPPACAVKTRRHGINHADQHAAHFAFFLRNKHPHRLIHDCALDCAPRDDRIVAKRPIVRALELAPPEGEERGKIMDAGSAHGDHGAGIRIGCGLPKMSGMPCDIVRFMVAHRLPYTDIALLTAACCCAAVSAVFE